MTSTETKLKDLEDRIKDLERDSDKDSKEKLAKITAETEEIYQNIKLSKDKLLLGKIYYLIDILDNTTDTEFSKRNILTINGYREEVEGKLMELIRKL